MRIGDGPSQAESQRLKAFCCARSGAAIMRIALPKLSDTAFIDLGNWRSDA
tara:strand:+ start:110 stop:262 length:153 start_codon:yes stop_codon:yes gene_type:complete